MLRSVLENKANISTNSFTIFVDLFLSALKPGFQFPLPELTARVDG